MSKQANSVSCGKTTSSVPIRLRAGRLKTGQFGAGSLSTGAIIAGALLFAQVFAPAATAQQAYYYPQAGSPSVSVNYDALTPYLAPPYTTPAMPGVPAGFQPPAGFQTYGYAGTAPLTAQPRSVFLPYAMPMPAYAATPYGYAAAPATAPFVAPYANPAFATSRLLASTPAASSAPQSYLTVTGAQPLIAAEATPVTKVKKKKKKATTETPSPAATPTAIEEGAAAQVAAAEATLESIPVESTPTMPVVPEEPAAEPVPAPVPPAEPTAVPASVPSPAAGVPATAVAEAPATEPEAGTTADPAAAEQVASAEAPAGTVPDTGGDAVLPAGVIRIVFAGDSDDLPQGATGDLDATAAKMLADETIKVQVLAYSSGTPDAESQARRKALARGLEVRKYLIGKGVRSNRIDVRALGSKSEGGPADRVDIVPGGG